MPDASQPCSTHPELVHFKYPLPHLADSIKRQRKIKIVAIGSSSTLGEGDLIPYPSRLQLALRKQFHDRMIDVLNRGLSGQESPSELSRFEPDVFAEAPALVIWQVGTNAVFRSKSYSPDDVVGAIATGLRWLADLPLDVVLMDLQYTPAVVDKGKLALSEELVRRIAVAAEAAGVNVFRRFALMQHWVDVEKIPIDRLVRAGDPDHLHMSEWATGCVSAALFESINKELQAAGVT